MHNLIVTFIPGIKLGIEFFIGEDLEEGDAFALTLDLLVLRFTYFITKED